MLAICFAEALLRCDPVAVDALVRGKLPLRSARPDARCNAELALNRDLRAAKRDSFGSLTASRHRSSHRFRTSDGTQPCACVSVMLLREISGVQALFHHMRLAEVWRAHIPMGLASGAQACWNLLQRWFVPQFSRCVGDL